MAKKLILAASPTFKSKVAIPIPGGSPVLVEFTFKHRQKDDLFTWAQNLAGMEDVDLVKDVASGWDLDDEFNDANITALTQTYCGSARAILDRYFAEQTGAKLGN